MENTELHTHKLENEEKFGEVRIADEVVAIIAGLAASEVRSFHGRECDEGSDRKAWHEEPLKGREDYDG